MNEKKKNKNSLKKKIKNYFFISIKLTQENLYI